MRIGPAATASATVIVVWGSVSDLRCSHELCAYPELAIQITRKSFFIRYLPSHPSIELHRAHAPGAANLPEGRRINGGSRIPIIDMIERVKHVRAQQQPEALLELEVPSEPSVGGPATGTPQYPVASVSRPDRNRRGRVHRYLRESGCV